MVLKANKPIQINANYRKTEKLLESGDIDIPSQLVAGNDITIEDGMISTNILNYEYNYSGETPQYAIVTGFKEGKYSNIVKIPATDPKFGVPVTEIGIRAFTGKRIDYVSIPYTVTKIDDYAFASCGVTDFDFAEVHNPLTLGTQCFRMCNPNVLNLGSVEKMSGPLDNTTVQHLIIETSVRNSGLLGNSVIIKKITIGPNHSGFQYRFGNFYDLDGTRIPDGNTTDLRGWTFKANNSSQTNFYKDSYIYTGLASEIATKQNKLPTYSASDAGKVLSIDSDGNLVWVTLQ